jgi:hypothetical protein
MKTMLRWASALCMLSVSTIASALSPLGVGYNEPWIEGFYGNWLASNPFFGSSQFGAVSPGMAGMCPTTGGPVKPGPINPMFSGMMQGNAKIVRIWLFPALQGININNLITPPPAPTNVVTDELKQNLGTVFTLAKNCNLKLYITALNAGDAAFVANPNNCPPTNKVLTQYCGVAKPYFTSLFSNPSAYENSVLGPVLDLMTANQGVIYGFDLINEIESAINAGYFSWAGAQTWIQNMITFVKSRAGQWLPVTSSAGGGYAVQELTFGFFSGRGLNFYDVHIYSDMGQYSGQTWLCLRTQFVDHLPIVLGEYGQKSTCTSPTPQSTCDAIQKTATTNFLNGAKKSCFSSALAWKYELTFLPSSPFPAPWLSYLDINTNQHDPGYGNLLTPSPTSPPCPPQQIPVPQPPSTPSVCARPAYNIIQKFVP